jgi:hypothetical protein
MSLAHDLLLAAALAAPIALGTLWVVAATGPADADTHDLSDYHAPEDPPADDTDDGADTDPQPQPEPDRAAVVAAVVASQPFDPRSVPWTPPYAELVIAQVLRRYGDSPADIAGRWLRDIANVERQAVAA